MMYHVYFKYGKKNTDNRLEPEKLEPSNFIFVKQIENPDISVRRVGVNAGYVDVNSVGKSIQSHYFIKFTSSKTLDENIHRLSSIKYDFNNTVGPRSISKQELIKEFIKVL